MDNSGLVQDFHVGDRVALLEDDWRMVGLDFVLIEVEPVPGSSQCVIEAEGVLATVSRASLRRA